MSFNFDQHYETTLNQLCAVVEDRERAKRILDKRLEEKAEAPLNFEEQYHTTLNQLELIVDDRERAKRILDKSLTTLDPREKADVIVKMISEPPIDTHPKPILTDNRSLSQHERPSRPPSRSSYRSLDDDGIDRQDRCGVRFSNPRLLPLPSPDSRPLSEARSTIHHQVPPGTNTPRTPGRLPREPTHLHAHNQFREEAHPLPPGHLMSRQVRLGGGGGGGGGGFDDWSDGGSRRGDGSVTLDLRGSILSRRREQHPLSQSVPGLLHARALSKERAAGVSKSLEAVKAPPKFTYDTMRASTFESKPPEGSAYHKPGVSVDGDMFLSAHHSTKGAKFWEQYIRDSDSVRDQDDSPSAAAPPDEYEQCLQDFISTRQRGERVLASLENRSPYPCSERGDNHTHPRKAQDPRNGYHHGELNLSNFNYSSLLLPSSKQLFTQPRY
eukprot:Rmarinus@m.10514